MVRARTGRSRIGQSRCSTGPTCEQGSGDPLTTADPVDSVAMVPPFLAYYGGMTATRRSSRSGTSMRAIPPALRQPNNNLWRTFSEERRARPRHVGDSNAWAAWGMARVLATIKHSAFAGQMSSQQGDLAN